MRFTILSCSLDPDSRSRQLAAQAAALVTAAAHEVTLIDVRDLAGLLAFDNRTVFDDPRYRELHAAIATADGVIVASPVYNWSLSSAAKSVIELTGATGEDERRSACFDKLVTFMCAGGLPHSYMAYGATATALMLDFKCIVNPYLVYADERDWRAEGLPGPRLAARLAKTVQVKLELAEKLYERGYRSDWEI